MGLAAEPILVVDDDEAIRTTVQSILVDEGYTVLGAADGVGALDLVCRQPPSLILLDMKMPVMDGWGFARAYRAQPRPHAPIVVLTAAVNAGQRTAEIGARGYLAKPFNLDDLLAMVSQCLSHDRGEHE